MAPQFNNSYVNLPERFYARQSPVPVANPELIRVNHELANLLGIDPGWLESDEGIATIAAAFAPAPVIVRLSDFKSNEYANLIGGKLYEPEEENPMLGFRGASRYIS